MANASDLSPYILAAPDPSLPNSRTLAASGGIIVQDTGPSQSYTIASVGNLNTLSNYSAVGFLTYDATLVGFTSRLLNTGTGIAITAPAGQGANPTISVVEASTVQKVNVLVNGLQTTVPRSNLNFISAGSVSITSGEDSENINITITGSTNFSPRDAKYIVQTSDPNLPNAQDLSDLTTGLMKVTNGTGVITTAVANTDYQPASTILQSITSITPSEGTLISGNGTGYSGILLGSVGNVLTATVDGPAWQPPTGNVYQVIVLAPEDTSVILENNKWYVATASSGQAVNFSLPISPTVGHIYKISGSGSDGYAIVQGSNQQIKYMTVSTTLGGTGALQVLSIGFGYSVLTTIELMCIDAGVDKIFSVVGCTGNVTLI